MEDWSLQAIVKGSSGDFEKFIDVDMDGQDSFLDPVPDHPDRQGFHLPGFPEVFEASTGSSDELEDLYKPFYPAQAVVNFQEQIYSIGGGSCSKQVRDLSDQSTASSTSPVAMATSAGYSPKHKKRKNQHKRVVIKVSAEGLGSDMWAWRKYGQKPIKGSPYPRSYYRCSSSKGCLARKQVEQSCTDPGMFILTYTAEHSHSQPTRRNSLAGTVRQKFPSAKTQQTMKQEKPKESLVSPQIACPNQVWAGEVALFPQAMIKEESQDQEIEARLAPNGDHAMYCQGYGDGDGDGDGFFMPSFEFGEDFFSGLEEFEEFISDLPPCQANSAQQFPVR